MGLFNSISQRIVQSKYFRNQSDLTAGLYAYWPLQTNTNDVIGTNHGTASGATLAATSGKVMKGAYSFNGTLDYIDLGLATFSSSAGTLSAWAQSDITATAVGKWVVSRNQGGNYAGDIGISMFTDEVMYGFVQDGVNSSTCDANSALTDTNWHHYVLVWDGTSTIFYVDGVAQTDTAAGISLASHASGFKFAIGMLNATFPVSGEGWDGLIGEVGLWTVKKTQANITKLYNKGKGLTY